MSDTNEEATGKLPSPSLRSVSLAVGIVLGLVSLFGIAAGYFDTRIDKVETSLEGHRENSAIHRTAEEGRAWERGEQAKWELLMDRLQSIDKRLEKLEAKP